jgi:hypothetical protein
MEIMIFVVVRTRKQPSAEYTVVSAFTHREVAEEFLAAMGYSLKHDTLWERGDYSWAEIHEIRLYDAKYVSNFRS